MKYAKSYLQLRRESDRRILRVIGLTVAAGVVLAVTAVGIAKAESCPSGYMENYQPPNSSLGYCFYRADGIAYTYFIPKSGDCEPCLPIIWRSVEEVPANVIVEELP